LSLYISINITVGGAAAAAAVRLFYCKKVGFVNSPRKQNYERHNNKILWDVVLAAAKTSPKGVRKQQQASIINFSSRQQQQAAND